MNSDGIMSDEETLQSVLTELIKAYEPDGKTVKHLAMLDYIHYLLVVLACLTQELNGIDGRLINLNTELCNIGNLLEGRIHE